MNKYIRKRLSRTGLSSFQKRVLMAVSAIPPGQVRTYKWVARKIGRPSASRAVGNALNKNPIPVTVPCHRVIKSDYTIGGFSRGKKMKKELLLSEGLMVKGGTVIISEATAYGAKRRKS